jgi:SPP1 family predicted phage head-tail adaptor
VERSVIASLRHRITLQRQTDVDDGHGGFTRTWQTLAERWADARQLSAGEQFQRQRLETRSTHRFVLRYDANITVEDRRVWLGVTYVIRAINDPDGRHRWLEIDAESGVES